MPNEQYYLELVAQEEAAAFEEKWTKLEAKATYMAYTDGSIRPKWAYVVPEMVEGKTWYQVYSVYSDRGVALYAIDKQAGSPNLETAIGYAEFVVGNTEE